MITPGLERISLLLKHTPPSWKAIHIAGTNGKGSICAASSAMLKAAGIRTGRFTSPHLIDRWDCIVINQKPVSKSLFDKVEREVIQYNETEKINASEFEILTATAFNIFNREEVDVGVVEVGMGGRLDATNVLESLFVTVISKIGLDHQGFLGNTIEDIAKEKAGIIKPGVPCVVNATNAAEVLAVVQSRTKEVKAIGPHLVQDVPTTLSEPKLRKQFEDAFAPFRTDLEPFQVTNLLCAFDATVIALKALGHNVDPSKLVPAMVEGGKAWAGRLQELYLGKLVSRKAPILIDGAHNVDAARALAQYVERRLKRGNAHPITWLLAFTQGKNAEEILKILLKPGDSVVAVEFGPVDGMPWVKSMPAADVLKAAKAATSLRDTFNYGTDVLGGLRKTAKIANDTPDSPLVATGSLYLVSDVMRLRRDQGGEEQCWT